MQMTKREIEIINELRASAAIASSAIADANADYEKHSVAANASVSGASRKLLAALRYSDGGNASKEFINVLNAYCDAPTYAIGVIELDKLTMTDIKQIVHAQSERLKKAELRNWCPADEELRDYIETDFLSDYDITDRSDEFSDDVDLEDVEILRAEALDEVLTHWGV